MFNSATHFKKVALASGRDDYVALLSLSRPEVANALSSELIGELTAHLTSVAADQSCRALILRGSGKHFSAGADLGWMKEAAKLDYDGNLRDSEQLIRLFEALANLPFPSIACVQGSAYGGAVGLAAACDIVLAVEGARFCLSEVKLGLIPAVILPYLVRKVAPGSLRYWAVTGRLISPSEALAAGLVQRVVAPSELDQALHEELNAIVQAAPEAQSAVKTLLREVIASGAEQGLYTAEAIAKARVSASGRDGLAAFFAKSSPSWAIQLAPNWRLD